MIRRIRSGLFSLTLWNALRQRHFPMTLLALCASSFGFVVSYLAIGWATEELTHSPLAVAGVFAARLLPQATLGMLGGALADAMDRRRLVVVLNAVTALLALAIALAAIAGQLSFGLLLGVSLLSGTLDGPRMSASLSYAYELAGEGNGVSALALTNLGTNVFGIGAGLLGGVALSAFGPAGAFLAVAAGHAAASALIGWRATTVIPTEVVHEQVVMQMDPLAPVAAGPPRTARLAGVASDVGAAVREVLVNRRIRLLAVVAIAMEIFAFSGVALLPTFADRVFALGPTGLGTMLAVRSAGAVLGLGTLPWLREKWGAGPVLMSLAGLFGVALIAFGLSDVVFIAFGMLGFVGFAGAGVDALIQTLLQDQAGSGARGSAVGIWVTAIGFGPIGQLEIGALATALGPAQAQAANGLVVVVFAALLVALTQLRSVR